MTIEELYKVVNGEFYVIIECANSNRYFELDMYFVCDIIDWLKYENKDTADVLDNIYYDGNIVEMYANRNALCVKTILPEEEYNALSDDIDAYYEAMINM